MNSCLNNAEWPSYLYSFIIWYVSMILSHMTVRTYTLNKKINNYEIGFHFCEIHLHSCDFRINVLEIGFIRRNYYLKKLKFNLTYRIPNFISMKMIYISRKTICINRKLNCISRISICIGRKWSCMSRKPIVKKMKKDSCAGNWVSDLWNQNSFVWIQISFVRNPPGNGIEH